MLPAFGGVLFTYNENGENLLSVLDEGWDELSGMALTPDSSRWALSLWLSGGVCNFFFTRSLLCALPCQEWRQGSAILSTGWVHPWTISTSGIQSTIGELNGALPQGPRTMPCATLWHAIAQRNAGSGNGSFWEKLCSCIKQGQSRKGIEGQGILVPPPKPP